jgi:hypothetical protein
LKSFNQIQINHVLPVFSLKMKRLKIMHRRNISLVGCFLEGSPVPCSCLLLLSTRPMVLLS